jgi:hypothetical protein
LSTRVEIGHIRIGAAGYGLNKSYGSGSSLPQGIGRKGRARHHDFGRHFYFKARILEGLGAELDWKALDQAWEQCGR